MLKDRQEILAVGELALFVAVWCAAAWGAIDSYRHREKLVTGNSVASSTVIEPTRRPFE